MPTTTGAKRVSTARRALAGVLLRTPTRPNYFAGRLLTTQDFEREQEYHCHSRRRLALLALGEGVACGLRVVSTGTKVRVSPGVAIDALGREVVVPAPVELTRGPADRYVALRYAENFTDPVPTADGSVEHACVEEGYSIVLTTAAPASTEADPVIVLSKLPARRGKRA
jgi:hypothetical protein